MVDFSYQTPKYCIINHTTDVMTYVRAHSHRKLFTAPATVRVIQRMLVRTAEYLWEIVSSIKGNCFMTSDLLMEINFGRAPKFFLRGTFGNYLIC